uniref:Phosphatase and actin regulator n=1 Tax=Amphilophus citrinellus TaxID=61819 RepID=A0A3Q0RKB5_AMPCI
MFLFTCISACAFLVEGLEKSTSLPSCDVAVDSAANAQNAHASRQQRGKLSTLGKLFKPWKWRKKKTSDKFQDLSKVLERKISTRQTREELIRKGVLIPDQGQSSHVNNSTEHTSFAEGEARSSSKSEKQGRTEEKPGGGGMKKGETENVVENSPRYFKNLVSTCKLLIP